MNKNPYEHLLLTHQHLLQIFCKQQQQQQSDTTTTIRCCRSDLKDNNNINRWYNFNKSDEKEEFNFAAEHEKQEFKVTMKITPLQEITPEKGKANIKVKVVSLWKQYYNNNNPSKVAGMDMILMDEQGTKIHATIYSSLVCDFDTLLKESNYHIISNFNIKRNVDSTKLSKHEFKIHFYKKTNVRNCSEFICNDDEMDFISFKDFLDAKIDQSYSFDVIGRLVQNKDITILNPNNAPKHILEFQLQDATGSTIPCILWNDLAIKLHEYIKNLESSTEPIIVLIKMARQSIWNRVTQVSNCFAGSKLIINEDNPHIKAFRDLFESTNLSLNEKSKVELSSNTIVRKPEDYYSQFPLMTIDELYDLSEPTGCVVIGKVLKIVNDHGWYYMICSNCNSVVKPSESKETEKDYNCDNCQKKADLFPRIKIHIRVQDDSGSATFCLFQQDVAKLLGKSVGYLISKIDKDEENSSYPTDLESIVSRQFVFKLQVSAYNVNNNYHIFTVNKLTDDKVVMKLIGSKQTEEEEKETAKVGSKRKNSEFHNCEMEKKPKVEHQNTEDDTVLNKTDDKDIIAASQSKEKEEEVCKSSDKET